MDISDLMKNYNNLLKAGLPYLLRSGVDVDSDEWDGFVELTFEITVALRVVDGVGRKINWEYGTWGFPLRNEAQIFVLPPADGVFFVGVPETFDGIVKTLYREEYFEDITLQFAFREFAHPLKEPGSIGWIDWIHGEIIDESQPFPRGARVCCPIAGCNFNIK